MKGEPEPKPFLFVRMPQSSPQRKPAPTHERLDTEAMTGRLELRLEVVSAFLFVGAGGYDFRDHTVYYTFARSGQTIVIPGTSFKGAVRSLVETFSNSCMSLIGRGEREPRTHQRCQQLRALCPACRLFGMTGKESYGGRVGFADGHAETLTGLEIVKVGELHRPSHRIVPPGTRKFYADRRFPPSASMEPERNYRFMEAVKQGSVFTTTLSFTNVTQEELSLLFHALGIQGGHIVKIGGAKPRGFGSVRFTPYRLTLWQSPFAPPERLEGAELEQCVRRVSAATGLVQADLVQQYQQQVSAATEQFAPRELY